MALNLFTLEKRHASYYADFLRTLEGRYEQGGDETLEQTLAAFDAAWVQIKHGFAWSQAHSSHDDTAFVLTSDYPDGGAALLNLRQGADERIVWLQAGLAAAEALDAWEVIHSHLMNLGIAYDSLGKSQKALEYQQRAMQVAEKTDTPDYYQALSLGNLATVYSELGQFDEAIRAFKKAFTFYEASGDHRALGIAKSNLGSLLTDLGRYDEALLALEAALAVGQHFHYADVELQSLNHLGIFYRHLDQYEQATDCLQRALLLSRQLGDRDLENTLLGNLGNLALDEGDFEQALLYLKQGLEISRDIQDRKGEGIHLGNLGRVYQALGDDEKALTCFCDALAISVETHNAFHEAIDLNQLGVFAIAQERYEEATAYFKRALLIHQQLETVGHQADIQLNLAICNLMSGHMETGLDGLFEAQALYETLGAQDKVAEIAEMIANLGGTNG